MDLNLKGKTLTFLDNNKGIYTLLFPSDREGFLKENTINTNCKREG